MLECKQSQFKQFFLFQEQITQDVTVGFDPSNSSGPIKSTIKLVRDLMVTYILDESDYGSNPTVRS